MFPVILLSCLVPGCVFYMCMLVSYAAVHGAFCQVDFFYANVSPGIPAKACCVHQNCCDYFFI